MTERKGETMAFEKLSEAEREELRDALGNLYTFLNGRLFELRNERDAARAERDAAFAERDELRALVARYRAGVRDTDVAVTNG